MAQSTTQILLPQTAYSGDNVVLGSKVPAAAYYIASADLQTLTWNVTSLSATITLQATLATDPVLTDDNDWFTVFTNVCDVLTETNYSNITGNFVWLRVKVVGFTSGVIQNIKVSY
jgi:hypothetical protein